MQEVDQGESDMGLSDSGADEDVDEVQRGQRVRDIQRMMTRTLIWILLIRTAIVIEGVAWEGTIDKFSEE